MYHAAAGVSITTVFGGSLAEDRLFAMLPESVDAGLVVEKNYARIAKAVEMMLAAKLMLLGHHVAIPLEDDGVDLIVDYRVGVQVKSTLSRNSSGSLKLKLRRSRGGRA